MFVNEQVWLPIARQPQHGVVEVFDPSADGLPIAQLEGHHHLSVTQRSEIEGFLTGFTGRRRLGAAARSESFSCVEIAAGSRGALTDRQCCSRRDRGGIDHAARRHHDVPAEVDNRARRLAAGGDILVASRVDHRPQTGWS